MLASGFLLLFGDTKAPLPVPEDQSTDEPQVGGALLEEQSKDRGKAVDELGGGALGTQNPRGLILIPGQ